MHDPVLVPSCELCSPPAICPATALPLPLPAGRQVQLKLSSTAEGLL